MFFGFYDFSAALVKESISREYSWEYGTRQSADEAEAKDMPAIRTLQFVCAYAMPQSHR
jgi:hypothetical protein